uniref:CCHC-type domain-containing protein n=1 Tax=Tanacetum cinerariifolium TaxID=118510 RepID=A0A6L2MFL4_TANCI|nr:hypothetical protein [Tanacetum cinerariifolium]
MGSMLMANGEECLDGWVGAGRGEVNGGGVEFGVILLGEILEESMGESGGEEFGVEGGAVCTNNTKQTQTTLHNAIMEAGGKDRPPMLAPGNYVQWKSKIKRYIDTKPNHELIHYCLKNPLYKYTWADKALPVTEGSSETITERGTGYDNQRIVNVAGARETVGTTMVQKSGIQCYNCKEFRHVARECQKPKRAKDAAYHQEKMLLYAADNSGPIFDTEPLEKVPNNDHYNVFAFESEHPEQSKSVNDTYPIEQDKHNVIIDSLDMSYNIEQIDQNDDDDDDLANERDLLASIIEKLKCEIDDSKTRNKFLETSNKVLVDKLQAEIEDLKTKNKSLESSNNHFKEANNELSKTNELMYKDLKKFQVELDRYNDVKYASKVEINCAKAKGDLMSYKMESEKSFNAYTRKINDLNQTISEMKKELFAHQETISILSQAKEAQLKFYKTRKDKEIVKVIVLENKIKDLDNIVYKTGQSVQTMNMLNRNYKTSFAKPEFLKKA